MSAHLLQIFPSVKPYYEENGITIYHADCREILPYLEHEDLTLTDPPYGVELQYGIFDDRRGNVKALVKSVLPLLLSKSTRALVTCGVLQIPFYPEPTWILRQGVLDFGDQSICLSSHYQEALFS